MRILRREDLLGSCAEIKVHDERAGTGVLAAGKGKVDGFESKRKDLKNH